MTDSAAIERAEWDARASTPEGALYQAWAGEDWDEATERHLEQIIPYITRANQFIRVFDLGCGPGRLALPITERMPGCKVFGVDISLAMITLARARANSRDAIFIQGDGRTIPLMPYFDAGYSMQMFQHIPPEAVQGYLKEVHRVLNPGGVFRFQYVEGNERGEFGYQFYQNDVRAWCESAHLTVEAIDTDPYQFNWRWVTAVKHE